MADSDQLEEIDYDVDLKMLEDSSDLIFVGPLSNPPTWFIETFPIRFVLFRVVNSSYECLAVERTTGLALQTVGFIE